RLNRAGVPVEYRTARTKPQMALVEIDRAIAAGVPFGCVLADAGYGLSAPFRQGLTARKLAWAVGIPRHLKVYPADVRRSGRLPSAVVRVSGTFLTFYRYRLKTCWPMLNGAHQLAHRHERKAYDDDRLRLPPASPARNSKAGKKEINGPPPQPTLP